MPSRFAAVNKQRNFTTNQASCSRKTRRRWRSSGWKFYQVKPCLFDLNLSIKPAKKFFLYKCKLSLSLALLYWVDLFINKLKTKFNNIFYRMILKTKRIQYSFWGNFPARAAVRSLHAKIVIVAGNSKWVKNHHFCAQLSHCFSIY